MVQAPTNHHQPGGTGSHQPSTHTGGGSGGPPTTTMTSSNNSQTSDNMDDNTKLGIAAIGVALSVLIIGYLIIRRGNHKHHLVGTASEMHFNDLELVESRKQQHFTNYGENGYMPNFS